MLPFIAVLLLPFFLLQVGAQTCSPTSDCAEGCCSVFGSCGFGPAFCGAGNCTSSCNAQAQCGEFAPAGQSACPLNVCCSQFGFCGTTSDFCGTGCQNGCDLVVEPSASGSSSNQRTIGYYESWNVGGRTCDVWEPENINPTLWTHINYAFALIDNSFQLGQMNSYDIDFYNRVVSLKQRNPSLQVFISVGGWNAGGAIFSSMASTAANRATFISSALSLMHTYGFDGIDIDWEYPAAGDRGGVPEDTANFVQLLKELRAACGTKYGITATIPSSYWYMQGFDVVGMEPYLDWFNFMSYDIHGIFKYPFDILIHVFIRDGDNPNTQAVVQPHTNLTEISEGLDLLWRNNISPSKVVLGLGFYGRSFTLKDPSCNVPLCPFSGGGNPGECTATAGILSNAEIQRIIIANDITPILEPVAGVKYMSWDNNQWVSYDDEETYTLKHNFANGLGLGGTMAWALDLDDPMTLSSQSNLKLGIMRTVDGDQVDANPSFALSKLAANQFSDEISAVMFWTSCSPNPSCPPGFHTPTDGMGHGKVFDIDLGHISADGCHGGSKGYNRALCVEDGVSLNNCGWYGKPKKCGNTCPKGYELISMNTQPSNTKTSCQSGKFASYCCSSITTNFNNLGYCPVANLANTLSGGLSSRLVSVDSLSDTVPKAVSFGSSNGFSQSTEEECAYASYSLDNAAGGFLGQLGAVYPIPAGAIPNFLPGVWQPLGNKQYELSPLFNTMYPTGTASSLQCSATASDQVAMTRTWTTTETKTCDGHSYPQACQHYRSVISVYGASILSCAYPLRAGSIPRPEVNSWNNEHRSQWISWIPTWGTISRGAYNGINSYCDRDEYPPAYFLQGTGGVNAPLINTAAYIRFLPQAENGGAGQLWSGFCATNPKSNVGPQQGGQVVGGTCFYTKTTTYSLKAFTMAFKSMPAGPDDGLTTNMCWPSNLAVNPGFALLSTDSWYARNLASKAWIPSYKSTSVPAILTNGKGNPPRTRVPGKPLKRDEQFILPDDDLTPTNIFVDNGNNTRRPTDEELLEHFGFLKCSSPDCEDEARALGFEPTEEYVPAPEVITASEPQPTAAYVGILPASAASVSRPTRTPSVSMVNGYSRPAEQSSRRTARHRHQRSSSEA